MSLGYIAGVWVPRTDTTNQDDVRARPHLKVVSGNRKRNRGEKRRNDDDDAGPPDLVLGHESLERQISLLSYDLLGFLVRGEYPGHTTTDSSDHVKADCCCSKSTQGLKICLQQQEPTTPSDCPASDLGSPTLKGHAL